MEVILIMFGFLKLSSWSLLCRQWS